MLNIEFLINLTKLIEYIIYVRRNRQVKLDEKIYAEKIFISKNIKIEKAINIGKAYIDIAKKLQRFSFLL